MLIDTSGVVEIWGHIIAVGRRVEFVILCVTYTWSFGFGDRVSYTVEATDPWHKTMQKQPDLS